MRPYTEITAEIDNAPAGPQIAALFDFDGTIIAGYSVFSFLREQVRRGDLAPSEIVATVDAVARFGLGKKDFATLMTLSAQSMKGLKEDDYLDVAQKIFERDLAKKIFPETRALIEAHMRKGHTVAIISSATPYQVTPCANYLGIDKVSCSTIEVKNGIFTGELGGPLCFGVGKVDAALAIAKEHDVDLADSYFYSDSTDDIELLEYVGKPRPLNPSTKLREIAGERGWPMRTFHSRSSRSSAIGLTRNIASKVSLVGSVLAGLPIWALTGSKQEARNFSMSLFADISSAVTGLKLDIVGEQNLWAARPAVFIFNHQSDIDVMICAKLLRRNFAGVGKAEIKQMPLIGMAMEYSGIVLINRSDSRSAIKAMEPLIDRIRNERISVAMAPEGTRTHSKHPKPFKKGAFHVAMQAGVPIIPIVIHNAMDVSPKGDSVYYPGTVEVEVLAPVDTSRWTTANLDKQIAKIEALYRTTLDKSTAVE
ncbi:HAD-IB family hydrolase [uncultured Zhongshania sp.]|uniref:HAD-IB family hydrolase n=1 Tax=uncultured Zhongshania sp. TaxID=1642288 RepID=UPI0025DDBC81|nr:HAD-IB family hydrolase [uncultured Zhongshania sp.]|tara:strand:- start:3425 stop:4867 length:1443 start_codon:yes stop_codon:yes gene_type:complete